MSSTKRMNDRPYSATAMPPSKRQRTISSMSSITEGIKSLLSSWTGIDTGSGSDANGQAQNTSDGLDPEETRQMDDHTSSNHDMDMEHTGLHPSSSRTHASASSTRKKPLFADDVRAKLVFRTLELD